ncbi:MAG: hypothetical protein JOZ22_22345, partial [Acidobacteriia bacterium]|nr:hypothetical protein [Terriglobia bacterium]
MCLLVWCISNVHGQNAIPQRTPESGSTKHPCLPCHPSEVERFAESPMGKSLTTRVEDSSGHFTHKASGSVFTIYGDANGGVRHRLEERGLTADYPIAYSIGYGIVGRSFMVDLNGHLFQSPASFYVAHGWDVSPGYQDARMLDFDRAPAADCWVCHAGSVQQTSHSVKLTP